MAVVRTGVRLCSWAASAVRGSRFGWRPLRHVYGLEYVQESPQAGNFPLLGLEAKKVVLLDEWAFNESVLPLATQLLWYEGKPLPITRPQNKEYQGHLLYRGSAPLFVTCKEKDLPPLMQQAQEAVAQGRPNERTMLLRRLNVYGFSVKLGIRPHEEVAECAA